MNIRNNLRLSFRHLKADKINTFISITGLVVGLGIVSIVLVFVLNELNYNRSYAHGNRIYRILDFSSVNNHTWAGTPFVLGEKIKDQFDEVESVARQYNIGNVKVKKDNEYIAEPEMMCTNSAFFSMFGIPVLEGSLDNFDGTDNKILLSKSLSTKYFGNEDPIGKTLYINYLGKEFPMEVSLIFQDIPKNSTIKPLMIASMNFGFQHLEDNLQSTDAIPSIDELRTSWNSNFYTNFILLKKGVDPKNFEKKLKELGKENSTQSNKFSLSLQSLSDIYFGSQKIVDNNSSTRGNKSMLFILAVVGLIILIVASINYLNLASARALSQIKNFAVQRVCGARQKSIVFQLIFESSLITILALPFAVLLAWITMPYASSILGKSYPIQMSGEFFACIAILALISLLTGILSGSLIAIYFSRQELIGSLKGNRVHQNNKHPFRKAMVVFQLAVFIVLITTMLFVQKQVNYAIHKDLGFNKEGLVCVPLGDHNLELFKQEILKNPNVLSASGTLWMPPSSNKMYLSVPRVNDPKEVVKLNGLFVDYGFAQTVGLKIIMGSDLEKGKNNSGVLVNESAVKELGLTTIIGEHTAFGPVVGLVSDFNMFSLHEAITPMLIGLNPGMSRNIAIRLRTENLPQTIRFLRKTWKNTGGHTAFQMTFTNDRLKQMYWSDIRFSQTVGLLAVVAILIASLGLFGLSLLMGKQRIKEIGIRKVNGARITEILAMLNKDFVEWVIIAFLLAAPVAYYAINKWLENFAYKTSLSWWVFALAGLSALVIALITVSFQSWKAAIQNPVKALRYE